MSDEQVTVTDILEMSLGMGEQAAAEVVANLVQSFSLDADNHNGLIVAIAGATATAIWKKSGKKLTEEQADKLIERCRKEAQQFRLDVDIAVESTAAPEKPKNDDDLISGFNFALGRRITNRDNLPDLVKAIWVAILESSGVRKWIIQKYNKDAARHIKNQSLKALVTAWFRQVEVENNSAFVNGNIEILGTEVRKEAVAAVVSMFQQTEFDPIMAALQEYRRGTNRATQYQVMGVKGVETHSFPDQDELAHRMTVLLEQLNRLYGAGLHAHNVTALYNEYAQIIYPALNDRDFASGMVYVGSGQSALEALQENMPQDVRFGLQLAQFTQQALAALIKFDENTEPVAQFVAYGPMAQQYGLAAKDYGRTIGASTGQGFVGIVGIAEKLLVRVGIKIGGMEFKAELGFGAEVAFDSLPYQHMNSPMAFVKIFGPYLETYNERRDAWTTTMGRYNAPKPRLENGNALDIWTVLDKYGQVLPGHHAMAAFLRGLQDTHGNLKGAINWYLPRHGYPEIK